MEKVSVPKVVMTLEATESPLPPRIQEALGELVGAAREGLLALSVGVGLGVVHELMELEVDEALGPRGKHNPDRVAVRHGHEDGAMTLGGRRVTVRRPRVRSADDEGSWRSPVTGYRDLATLVIAIERHTLHAAPDSLARQELAAPVTVSPSTREIAVEFHDDPDILQLKDEPVTANAVNPGYVLTSLTKNVTGLLTALVVLTSFTAQTPVDGADTAIGVAASPELERVRQVLEQAARGPVQILQQGGDPRALRPRQAAADRRGSPEGRLARPRGEGLSSPRNPYAGRGQAPLRVRGASPCSCVRGAVAGDRHVRSARLRDWLRRGGRGPLDEGPPGSSRDYAKRGTVPLLDNRR
jgi:hypothetical protein